MWAALSELWLDTELTEDDLQRIAGVMKRSGYSVPQLREIYLFEVAPVVFRNLYSRWGMGWVRRGMALRPGYQAGEETQFVPAGVRHTGNREVAHDLCHRAALGYARKDAGERDLTQIRLYLTASETMSQLQCKCCLKEVHPGRGDYYLVRIDAVADPQPPIITQEDLDQDIGAEIERLIRRMKSMSEQQLEPRSFARR